MKATIEAFGVEATIDENMEWSCQDENMKKMLDKIVDSNPELPSHKDPVIAMASWCAEILGGDLVSYDEPRLIEGAIY